MNHKLKKAFFNLMDKQLPNLDLTICPSNLSVLTSYAIGSVGTFFVKIYDNHNFFKNENPSYIPTPIMELEIATRSHLNPEFLIQMELIAVYSDECRTVKKIMSLNHSDFIELIDGWLKEKGLEHIFGKIYECYMSNLKSSFPSFTSNTFNPYEYSNSTY